MVALADTSLLGENIRIAGQFFPEPLPAHRRADTSPEHNSPNAPLYFGSVVISPADSTGTP